jgi:multisubunit Na+/H+ antiporter MnhB subunit
MTLAHLILVIIGFITGLSVATGVVILALAGSRDMTSWAIARRFPSVELLAWLAVITCGVVFAYLAYLLA